jgi:hypothetical protein
MEVRSTDYVLQFPLDVKFWILTPPTVEECRPARCPGCGAASRVPGRPLVLVGHGLRERALRGATAPGSPDVTRTIAVRRFRCRNCGAVPTLVPRQVVARRHFSAGAIALALYLYGKLALAADEVAQRIGLWGRGPSAVRTLRRWMRAVEGERLFRGVRGSPIGWSLRKRAERVAMTVAAYALEPETTSEPCRVFAGAALAA